MRGSCRQGIEWQPQRRPKSLLYTEKHRPRVPLRVASPALLMAEAKVPTRPALMIIPAWQPLPMEKPGAIFARHDRVQFLSRSISAVPDLRSSPRLQSERRRYHGYGCADLSSGNAAIGREDVQEYRQERDSSPALS